MRRLLPLLVALVVVSTAYAQEVKNDPAVRRDRDTAAPADAMNHFFPPNPEGTADISSSPDDYDVPSMTDHGPLAMSESFQHTIMATNLSYHGGDVINTAHVVCIFWGPTWASGGSDNSRATTIQSFRNQPPKINFKAGCLKPRLEREFCFRRSSPPVAARRWTTS